MPFSIKVNGASRDIDVDGDTPLLWVLRDVLGMTGTKYGCGIAQCGACTVHIDGSRGALVPAAGRRGWRPCSHHNRGHRRDRSGRQGAKGLARSRSRSQCGYCQSGQIMSAAALLANNPRPDDADIDAAMAGNICRCGTYVRIRASHQERRGQRREEARHDVNRRHRPFAPGSSCRAALPAASCWPSSGRCAPRPSTSRSNGPTSPERAVRAKRVHPHRQCRQDHAGDRRRPRWARASTPRSP